MSVWDCETKRRYVIKKDNRLFFTGLCLGKNTMKAKRERALAPTKRGVPPKAACDKREQFNCEMGFAIDEERGT